MRRNKLSRLFRPYIVVRMFVIAGMVSFGAIGIVQQVQAESSADYCAKYTDSSKLNACKSGIRGEDCADYAVLFDEETAAICRTAANAKASGQIDDTPTISVSPSPSGSNGEVEVDEEAYRQVILDACKPYQNDTAAALWCLYGGLGQDGKEGTPRTLSDCLTKKELQGSSTNQGACITGAAAGQSYLSSIGEETDDQTADDLQNLNQIQDLLDQTNSLSEYIDVLHQAGPDAGTDLSEEADNTFGSYINGAGKKQPINFTPATQENAPALIFFNGGGWHANDGTSTAVAEGKATKNNLDNGKYIGPPAGGGATARGYAVFDATYRLGSSGVYYMYEDVMRAIQHVRNNAAMYNIDASRIVIWGDSAGGSLSMRANASGKSGAKVAVGWSAPTNAYTALFKSFESMLIGMDHSTCIPTDLAGLTNFTDLLNGGSGNVAEYGQGLSSNDFSSIGFGSGGQFDEGALGIDTITQVLSAGQYAMQTSQNVEAISKQLEAAYNGGDPTIQSTLSSGLGGSVFNLSSKKLIECMDNFEALSPALFASPESSPAFIAGFDTDTLIDPQQAYDMRDKLLSLGIKAEAYILEGDADAPAAFGPTDNHLGYDPRFVCPTFVFIEEVLDPAKPRADCSKQDAPTETDPNAIPDTDTGGGGGGNGGGGAPSGQSSSESGPSNDPKKKCEDAGGRYLGDTGYATNVCRYSEPNNSSPERPNCTGESFYSTTHKSCIYHTDYTDFDGKDNEWGRPHGCGSARYIGREANGQAICGVGANAF